MADLEQLVRELRKHIEKMDKVSGKEFAILMAKALEDIEQRLSALERRH